MNIKRMWITLLFSLSSAYFLIYSAVGFWKIHETSAMMDAPFTVVIDAGHGGEDGGTTSVLGTLESNINLAVALKLEQILALNGIRTHMIRTEDISVHKNGASIRERKISDLNHRVEIVNGINKAVFVSIHQNFFDDQSCRGAQIFYAHSSGSKELAEHMRALIKQSIDHSNNRAVKKADAVYIMKKIQCAGVLVECGFLSNPTEASMLEDKEYQIKLSGVLGCALTQYINKGELGSEI